MILGFYNSFLYLQISEIGFTHSMGNSFTGNKDNVGVLMQSNYLIIFKYKIIYNNLFIMYKFFSIFYHYDDN